MRNPLVEERARQKAADKRRARQLRQDRRDPRRPVTADDAHPMGTRLCSCCGHTYPWRSYQTRAGAVPQCLPCRETPA